MRVKICGITNLEDAILCSLSGADEIGFNFFKGSKRYVSPNKAKKIAVALGSDLKKVGVFVNESVASILDHVKFVGLDAIQLHGDETYQFVSTLIKETDKEIIKAIRVVSPEDLTSAMDYDSHFILLDSNSRSAYGGTGRTFDWSIAANATVLLPYVYLAGGLDHENVVDAIRLVRPYAVDVASGVELSPGKKDPKKVETFIKNAKNA